MWLGRKDGSTDTVPVGAGQAVIERYNIPDRESAAFLTDIVPFTGKVPAGELSVSSKKLLDAEPRYTSLTANCLTVDGTPLYEVYKDDGTEKPLVFLLYGAEAARTILSETPVTWPVWDSMPFVLMPPDAVTVRRGRWMRWPASPKLSANLIQSSSTIWMCPNWVFAAGLWAEYCVCLCRPRQIPSSDHCTKPGNAGLHAAVSRAAI